mgnify:CR=1 FL=1
MSRYEAFCNITTDLQAIADVSAFDRKRVLPNNWVHSTSDTGDPAHNLYYMHNAGFCSLLFENGKELGAAETSEPNSNGEWRYVAADDRLEYFKTSSSASAMNAANFEEGMDFATLKQQAVNEAADMIRSFINRPIYPRKNPNYQGAAGREYDFILVRINALLAVANLIRRDDPDKAAEIEAMAMNDEDTGLLDKLKRREFVLWNETSYRSENGIVQVVSQHANSTGTPQIEIVNPPTVSYDEVKLIIDQGGTFAPGSANSTITYSVWVKDSTGLKMNQVVASELINGDLQDLAYGGKVIWGAGVYTTSDEYSVTFQSTEVQIGSVRSGQIYR